MELETYVWFEHPQTGEYVEFKVSFDYDFGQEGSSPFSSWECSYPSTADQAYITKVHWDDLPSWITEDMIQEKVEDNIIDMINDMYN